MHLMHRCRKKSRLQALLLKIISSSCFALWLIRWLLRFHTTKSNLDTLGAFDVFRLFFFVFHLFVLFGQMKFPTPPPLRWHTTSRRFAWWRIPCKTNLWQSVRFAYWYHKISSCVLDHGVRCLRVFLPNHWVPASLENSFPSSSIPVHLKWIQNRYRL